MHMLYMHIRIKYIFTYNTYIFTYTTENSFMKFDVSLMSQLLFLVPSIHALRCPPPPPPPCPPPHLVVVALLFAEPHHHEQGAVEFWRETPEGSRRQTGYREGRMRVGIAGSDMDITRQVGYKDITTSMHAPSVQPIT